MGGFDWMLFRAFCQARCVDLVSAISCPPGSISIRYSSFHICSSQTVCAADGARR